MRKYFFIFLAILFLWCSLFFVGCIADYDVDFSSETAIKIGEKGYNSLAEAIVAAEDGDAILVYKDIREDKNNEYVRNCTTAMVGRELFVAYEINKPIVIKGVSIDGSKPKINGSFLINIGEEKYKNSTATIDNLDITHGYVSLTDDFVNEKFLVGVRIFDGSVNVVNNNIQLIQKIDDTVINENDLSLAYGLMFSRPLNSELKSEVLHYDVFDNNFGCYKNKKGELSSAPVMIVQNFENIGEFMPAIVNTKASNFSAEFFNENTFENNNNLLAVDYDADTNIFNSIVINPGYNIDFARLNNDKCRFIFNGDFLNDNIINVDVYGIFVFTGDVKNVVFDLKSEKAKVLIVGEKLEGTEIKEFSK